ncbi:uncharacterized protein EAF02_005721 [Botrytis sinoallii]|uniref:uncharacterized protein n=1 Tax=Botrytis sinoallii TaxID=1463999 RepID=UPI00190014A1|nr:uncharacterized protein EAF02_005721 [Botrytis sinoallii]KAF7882358.1 hypothetical protein EAF02_005721 [Botrytis sinoallii]
MSSPYAGLPLRHPDKQIRLLRLEQSSPDGDDYCFSLTVHNFCDDAYHPRLHCHFVHLGRFCPTHADNSKTMRHHGVTDYLWIDSLCINQDNNEEKNFQVAIMGSIYKSALWVASCIGTGDTIGAIQPTSASDGDEEARIAREKNSRRFELKLPYFDSRPFEQRVSGKTRRECVRFGYARYALENPKMLQPYNFAISLKSKSGTFVDLVLRYKTAKATNPRDKIYALLSLLPKEDLIRQNLVIDYEQPTFHLFHAVARLLYSTYEDLEIGQKHQELCQIPQQNELHANLNIQAEEYAPLTLLEHINTWRQENEKWSKEHINELLPANLKTSRVTIMWPNLQTDIFPAMKEFLVNADVRDGDSIAKVVLGRSEIIYNAADHWTAAYAVLRTVKVKHDDNELGKDDDSIMDTSDDVLDGSSNRESEQEQGADVLLALHSWAIPVSQDLKILTIGENSDLSDIYRNQNPGVLILHHRDALIPLILDDRPLHALLYPAPAGSYLSTIQLDNNVECKTSPPLKQLSDFISDVFG